MILRKAKLKDADKIQELINEYAKRGLMLPRSLATIYEAIRDFWVCEIDGDVVGCVALSVIWKDLAEIRSLAVKEEFWRRGIGSSLVKACVKEARELGVERVFTLTYQVDFFRSLGFKEVDKKSLPHKIWKDCINCVKFPECDETALLITL